MASARRPLSIAFATALAFAAMAGCDRAPMPGDVKEWTPADHDRTDEKARAQQGQAPAQNGSARPSGSGGGDDLGAVVDLTWRQNCQPCHGPTGHGDGPNGPLVKAPDLTQEALQAKVSDEEMASTIKNGKNLMPKFDLSGRVVAGLVARIRASRGR